jgi:hypothetical protein
MHYVFFGLSLGSVGVGVLIWRSKLEPLRLYRGESGVRPDRYGFFLSAEWYRPEAASWLRLVGTLWIIGALAFILAAMLFVSAA